MSIRLILASTSNYRRALLARLTVDFDQLSPGVDEDRFKTSEAPPAEIASQLALEKAQAVASRIDPDAQAVVIGGDQLVSFRGRILGKPGTRARAVEQLGSLAGQSHELITAVAVTDRRRTITFVDRTVLTMRILSKEQIENYVDLDQPFDCAGSYKFEAHGVSLFERVECQDATAISGLPLVELGRVLTDFGINIPGSHPKEPRTQ